MLMEKLVKSEVSSVVDGSVPVLVSQSDGCAVIMCKDSIRRNKNWGIWGFSVLSLQLS